MINYFYSTNVRDLPDTALQMSIVLKSTRRDRLLVDKIASACKRMETSFASKYCHFFIDQNLPIYDSRAREALVFLLGKKYVPLEDGTARYLNFCSNFDRFQTANSIRSSVREIDHFLWIVGSCEAHRKGKRVKAGVRDLLKKQSDKDWLFSFLPPRG
ncbi:MAG: hypothetical protein EXR00_02390 [Alphaproteobacteria bacterium]|nr:hypothetical protein [Alphaproteobacteria bacterium]